MPLNQKIITSNVLNIGFLSVPREGDKRREDGERGGGGGRLTVEGGDQSRDGYYSRKYGKTVIYSDNHSRTRKKAVSSCRW